MAIIAIIGAGSCGLAAAIELLEAGHTVHMYDYAANFGGRAETQTWAISAEENYFFEKGAQYIQDSAVNPWTAIAQARDIALTAEQDMTTIVRTIESGAWQEFPVEFPPPAGVADLPNLTASFTLATAINTAGENYDAANGVNLTLIPAPPEPNNSVAQLGAALSWYGPIVESIAPWSYLASDLERQVTPADPGPNQFVNTGLQSLLIAQGNYLIATYPDTFIQHFNSQVTAINPGEHGLSVTAAHLITEDILEIAFRYCIVTSSVNAIQNIQFTPALDAPITQPLEYLTLGSYKKIALQVTALPAEILENTVYILNTEVAAETGLNNVVWQYWRWQLNPEILVVTVAGSQAQTLDGLGDDTVRDLAVGALQTAYPNLGNWTVVRSGVTNWSNAPGIRGAYSYTAPATFEGANAFTPDAFNARPNLCNAVFGTCVLFAGEATDTASYGTLAGAYNQGLAAAQRIITAIVNDIPLI